LRSVDLILDRWSQEIQDKLRILLLLSNLYRIYVGFKLKMPSHVKYLEGQGWAQPGPNRANRYKIVRWTILPKSQGAGLAAV
jgi:hypothetical protein